MKIFASVFAALWLLALAPSLAEAQDPAAAQNPRIALIIGNSAYPDHPLATLANDAGLIAQTLQAAGFEVVGARDLDQNTLRGALRDFLAKAAAIGPDMQAFVYLGGRGVQYDGDNYFVPVDAQIARDADIPIQAIKISDFSHALAATPGRARIVVIDAARANSLAADGSALAGGLGLIDPEDGTLMAFNAAPGTIAPDETGPYGVYGKSLAGAMREGGLPIDDVFAQTRLQVNQQTNGAVVPWSISKVKEPYSIFERAPDAPPPPALAAAADIDKRPLSAIGPDDAYSVALQRDTLAGYQAYLAAYPHSPQARRVRAILAARREAIFWRRSVNENSPRAYWTYLRVYPNGPHIGDARRRLEILAAAFAPPPDFAPLEYTDLPPPPPDELVYDTGPAFVFDGPDYGPPPPPPPYAFLPVEDDEWNRLPPPPPPAGIGYLPVLSIAIPLLAGAKVFHDRRATPVQQNVGAPPPLPNALRSPDHAPGAPPAAQPQNAIRPLPVVPGAAPAAQPQNAPKPLPVVPGAAPALQPQNALKPLPEAPAVQPQNALKPLSVVPGAAPAAQPRNALKPLPGAPVVQPQNALKPLLVVPGAAPGAQPQNALKPLPEAPAVQPQNALKPLPVPPGAAPSIQPRDVVKPAGVVPGAPPAVRPQIAPNGPPSVAAPKPLKPEVKAAPLAPRPALQEPRPTPQVVRPAPVAPPPVHVVPVGPPPARVAPVAPPPVQHVAPTAPPPVQHVAPPAPPPPHVAPPPPAPHAAPAAPSKKPPCGGPGQPACPK
jgi:uncharacterized caspase-like protein